MPVSLGSGDDGNPNDFTAALARRLGVNGSQPGYQYSSASPNIQNGGTEQQQDAPPSSAQLGVTAQQAAQQIAPQANGLAGAYNIPVLGGILRGGADMINNSALANPYDPIRAGLGDSAAQGRQEQRNQAGAGFIPIGGAIGALADRIAPGAADAALSFLSRFNGNSALQNAAQLGARGGAEAGTAAPGSALARQIAERAAPAPVSAAERLASLQTPAAQTVGQSGAARGGLGLLDRIPGAAPYSSAELGTAARPLADRIALNEARTGAAEAVRTKFPSELPIQNVVADNLGGMGGAIQRFVTNPNVYLGGGTAAGIGGMGLLAAQHGGNQGGSNAATPTGSTTPIIDAALGAQSPNTLATAAGRGGSLAGPTSTAGTIAPTVVESPAGGSTGGTPAGASTPTIQQPAISGPRGSVSPGIETLPSTTTGPTGSVTPGIETPSGSQGGTGTVPTSGGLPAQSNNPTTPSAQPSTLDQLTQQVQSSLQGIQSEIQNAKSPDVLNVFLQQGQSILDMLKQQEDQLRADAQAKGTTIDPATQFTLDTMQKQLDAQLAGVRENLNRRGLLQSGIELASENQVRSGSLSAQGQLLATRLSKIQQDLENGLKSVNSERIATARQFGIAGAQGQATADNNTLNRRDALTKAMLNAQLSLRGQQSTSDTAAAGQQNQSAIAAANRQSQQSIANANQQAAMARLGQSQNFTAQQNDLNRRASDARQAAALAAAAGNLGLKQAYDAQAADLDRQFKESMQQNSQNFTAGQNDLNRANQQPSANTTKLATNTFISQVDQAPSKQAAMDAYNSALQDGTFANSGADPVAILNAINAKQWGGGGFQWPWQQ